MFRKRKRRRVPGLNTASTADISFMLLIFFLVTTSLNNEKGLSRRLPPPPRQEQKEEMMVKESDLLTIAIDADNHLTCGGKTVSLDELKTRVETFVAARPATHVISVATDRSTSYDAYFNVQNTIVAAYNTLRDRYARQQFGHPYSDCNEVERGMAARQFPQRISEAEPADEKGGGQ